MIDFDECDRCGMTIIHMHHFLTGSNIDIDPLPVPDGNIVVDFVNGKVNLVRKPRSGLWQAHVTSCSALHKEVR